MKGNCKKIGRQDRKMKTRKKKEGFALWSLKLRMELLVCIGEVSLLPWSPLQKQLTKWQTDRYSQILVQLKGLEMVDEGKQTDLGTVIKTGSGG